jgi:hypothetical protein
MRPSDSLLRAVFAAQVQLPLVHRKETSKASIMEPCPGLFQDEQEEDRYRDSCRQAPCAHYFPSLALMYGMPGASHAAVQVPNITRGKNGCSDISRAWPVRNSIFVLMRISER